MQPLDIINEAIRVAPSEADRLLCWLINTAQPAKRQSLYERFSTAIDAARLTGLLSAPFPFPSLFTADVAERTWDNLLVHVQQNEGALESLSPFFCPSKTQFVPHAYPGRWAPVTWNAPLSPVQVRNALGLDGPYLDELVRIARALVAAEKSRAPHQNISARNHFAKLGEKPLRIAVLPYADTLPMVTMLYAVSDIVVDMGFGLASFYQQKGRDPSCMWIGGGFFNAGYGTNYLLKELAKANYSLATHQVFTAGFTRSVLIRGPFGSRKTPQLEHLSFVGQLGPDRNCVLDHSQSDSVIASYKKVNFQGEFSISEYLDPIVNWEIPLVLSFAGGLGGYGEEKIDGLALTVSTDAHLWASSFALNMKDDAANPGLGKCSLPTFRRGAWDPSIQSDAADDDKQSELMWFVPATTCSQTLIHRLETIVEHFIGQKVREGLEARHLCTDPLALSTDKLWPVARSLLAPLLNVFPSYRGPMLVTPPEVWMTKLRGPAAYINYSPTWREQLRSELGNDQAEKPGPFIEYFRLAA